MKFAASWRRIFLVLLALALPAGGCAARVLVEGRRELAESLRLRESDAQESLLHARRAASWYLPSAPHVSAAYRELRELATSAERRGDRETALQAWRSIRSASLSTRWLIEPHRRERKEADQAIARLSAESSRLLPSRQEERRDLEALHASSLSRDDAPRTAWVVVLLLGVVGWGGGAYRMLRRGVTPEGKLVMGEAKVAGLVAAAGAVAFVLGLLLA